VHDHRVGVLYEYFAAASDEAAAATIDIPGGPGGAITMSPELSAAVAAGDRQAIERLMRPRMRISEHGLPVLSVKGIDPVVQLGTLESLLTGVAYETIEARLDFGRDVAVRDGGTMLVLTLSDGFRQTLAAQTPERLDAIAAPWSQTEEFWGGGDPETLAHFLKELARLARHATVENHHLYCWVGV
jgi:hypothetical protein